MKRMILALLLALLLITPALAEHMTISADAGLSGDTVTGLGLTVPCNTTVVDFGDMWSYDLAELEAMLDQLPNVQEVLMYRPRMKREDMAELSERYPNVFFGWTLRVGDHNVRTDVTAFSTLHNGKSKFHSTADFEQLRYCKKLLALDIGHNVVTDISFLHELPNLRVLILGRNQIKDISVLAELHDLQYVELFSNEITDITPLTGLEYLMDVCIVNNQIKDFTPLFTLPSLKRLWCGWNPVNEYQYTELITRLPDVEINHIDHPTGGTWRTHDRYFVIKEMFHYGRYVPFAEYPFNDRPVLTLPE